jgi:septum formation protein
VRSGRARSDLTDRRQLILASQSTRRHELLRSLGLAFHVEIADVDEDWHDDEDPIAYVERVAQAKAETIADRIGRAPGSVILAADTTVDVDGRILAKPVDDDDARRMLHLLSHRTHQVHTAVFAWAADGVHATTVSTDVTFVRLNDELLDWYLATGEHIDKAGAYGMQGAAGALVARIAGSPSNVVGLPLAETVGVLRHCGIGLS